MIHLITLVFVFLSFFIPTRWKLPPETSLKVFIALISIYVIIYLTGRVSVALRKIDSNVARQTAKKYGFYFQFPNLACRISKLAAVLQIVLMISCLLSYNIISVVYTLIAYVICLNIRLACNPVFFAEEGRRKYHGKIESKVFMDRLTVLTYVYEIIYGRRPPLPK